MPTIIGSGLVRVAVEFDYDEITVTVEDTKQKSDYNGKNRVESYIFSVHECLNYIEEKGDAFPAEAKDNGYHVAAAALWACELFGYHGRLIRARMPERPYTPYGCMHSPELYDPDAPFLFVGID